MEDVEIRKSLAAGEMNHRAIDEHVEELSYISPSRIDTFQGCSMLYYFRYVLGMKRRPGATLLRGSAVHESVEKNALSRIETGEALPRDEVQDIAAQSFTRRVVEEDPELKQGDNLGAIKDATVRLATLHYDAVAPQSTPLHAEAPFTLEWGDGPPIEGYVDLVSQNPDGSVQVDEVKTAVNARTTRDKYLNKVQVPVYLAAFNQIAGATKAVVSVLSEKNLKRGTVNTVVRHELAGGDINLPRIKLACAQLMGALRSHVFGPANPSYFLCSQKWCGFHQDNDGPCPFGRKT